MLPLLTQGGGAEKYFINLARNFRDRGIEADVVTMDEKFFARFAKLLYLFAYRRWFHHIDISGRESEEAVKQQLGKARWVKTSFKNLRKILGEYDVVYAKNELVDLALLKVKGYKKLPPVIVGVHTPLIFANAKSFPTKLHNWLYLSFIYRWLLRGVKCVHASNSFTKNLVDKKFGIKSRLIFYPFSADKVRQTAENNKSPISFDANRINIIFAGRLSEQKGFDTLIHLIEKISEDYNLKNRLSLNVFGSGDAECEAKIKNLASKFPFVRYFGHVENKFIPNILVQNNLMVAPSKWETLPFVVLEAQSLGLPVVAFDIPGSNDIIENGKTGFLAGSKEEFFEKIKDIVECKISFDKDAVIQNIEKKFSPEKIYSQLIEMFENSLCPD